MKEYRSFITQEPIVCICTVLLSLILWWFQFIHLFGQIDLFSKETVHNAYEWVIELFTETINNEKRTIQEQDKLISISTLADLSTWEPVHMTGSLQDCPGPKKCNCSVPLMRTKYTQFVIQLWNSIWGLV